MTQRIRLPFKKRHIPIFDEDWTFLLEHFGPYSVSRLGASTAIRELVHSRVGEMRERNNRKVDAALSKEAAE